MNFPNSEVCLIGEWSISHRRRGDYKLIFTELRGEYELVITEPEASVLKLFGIDF